MTWLSDLLAGVARFFNRAATVGREPAYRVHTWNGHERWSDEDIKKLVAIAAKYDLNPGDILLIHLSELGLLYNGSGDPSKWHTPLPGQSASGMMQWIRSTSASLGVDHDAIMRMGISEQLDVLDKYAARYFAGRGAKTAADLYMINFIGGLCKTEACAPKRGTPAYDVNAALDLDRDGDIDITDLSNKLAKLANRWAAKPIRDVY